MLYLIETLKFDEKYSDKRHDIYWNGKINNEYLEVCFIRIEYLFNSFMVKPYDYVISRDKDLILLRN